LSAPSWAPPVILMGTSLLLRFPDGRLLSPRWKKVEWVAGVALVATVAAILFTPGKMTDSGYPTLDNPFGIHGLQILNALVALILLIPLTILASAASLIVRFRRSSGIERQQMKWLATAAAILAVVYLLAMVVSINYAWGSVPG